MRLARVITILDWERWEASRDQPWKPRGYKVFNGIRQPGVRGIKL